MTARITSSPTQPVVPPREPAAPSTPPTPAATQAASGGWLATATSAVTSAANTVANSVVGGAMSVFAYGSHERRAAEGTTYDWNPHRPMDAAPLPPLLDKLAQTPEGRQIAGQIARDFATYTGIPGSEALAQKAIENPRLLTEGLIVSPGDLSKGLSAMNAMNGGKPPAPPEHLLPQRFDFADLGSVAYQNPYKQPAKPGANGAPPLPGETAGLKRLADGLWQGDVPSGISDAQAKRNTVVAEVFTRLSENPNAPEGQKFEVTYKGKSFDNVADFTKALRHDGYKVSTTFRTRLADFADLKSGEPPNLQPLATPLMMSTGIKDANGKEAVVPVSHSEMVIQLESPPNAPEPKLDAKLRFFQGQTGTGFFPADIWKEGSWLGGVNRETLKGDQAQKAIEVASGFTALVKQSSTENKLANEGYGLTGVCNDSVAVVQQAMLGKVHEWPLLMKDKLLLASLAKQPPSAMRTTLEKAIRAAPNDVSDNLLGLGATAPPNADTRRRILEAIPFAPGLSPFTRTEDARRILGGH